MYVICSSFALLTHIHFTNTYIFAPFIITTSPGGDPEAEYPRPIWDL
jgi:hypothetical protein